MFQEETVAVVQSKRPKKTEAVRSAPPKKKKEETKEPKKEKEVQNQKADFALELDDMSDKVSDWDDKPKGGKKQKSSKSSDKKKKESDKSDDYNDNWDMSASYNELQLEDKGANKKTDMKKAEAVPSLVTNVNFDEIPNVKDKEPELKIDFFGTEADHSKNNQRNSNELMGDSENNQFGDANLFEDEFGDLEKEFNQ